MRLLGGILLIVGAGAAALYCAVIAFVFWVLGGGAGLAYGIFEFLFVPLALALGGLALGIHLVRSRPAAAARRPDAVAPREPAESRAGRRSPVSDWVAIPIFAAAAVALALVLSALDLGGGYPFDDVAPGGLIAYTADDGIRLVPAAGGRSWRVPGTGDLSGPHWAPDGRRFAAVDLYDCCKAYSVSLDGSSRARLPADASTTPVWSPDAARLAAFDEDDGRIHLRALDGRRSESVLPLSGNEPEWSPDGKLIAFQRYDENEVLRIYVVRPDGSGLRVLTPSVRGATGASSAAWAPGGGRLAFGADYDGDDEIYVIRVDGSGLRKLTSNAVDDSTPTWSPDGRRIAFARSEGDLERTSIVVADVETGIETEVASASDGIVFEPAWQPRAPVPAAHGARSSPAERVTR